MSTQVRPPSGRVGPFRILGLAGRGGMGVVYRAEHVETGERVALKTVAAPHEGQVAGIRCEIHALAKVRHPGVVRVVGSGVEDGLPWYAMELIEGRTLNDFFEGVWRVDAEAPTRPVEGPTPEAGLRAPLRGGPLPPVAGSRLREALTLIRRLCSPLAYLHGHGIVHRDLKPNNVFIRPDGRPVLVDFGLAAEFRGALGREVLAVAGGLMGTAWYMAPEQADRRFVDARTDLYALGVMLYEMLTGQRLFHARTSADIISQQRSSVPAAPSQLVEGVPPELDDLVLRLLAKRPRDRFGHADDVAEVLADLGAEGWPAEEGVEPHAYLYRPDLEGRREALDEFESLVTRAAEGEGGGLFLGGESGVGKTSLVAEVGRRAAIEGWTVITGECLPVGSVEAKDSEFKSAPLQPLRPLLQAIADRCREQGPEVTKRVLGERGKLLEPYAPELQALPGQETLLDPAPLAADAARRRLFQALAETLAAFASSRPVLLILDDLQWADELTMGFLEWLPRGYFTGKRLTLVGTYREEEVSDPLRDLMKNSGFRRLTLGRLDEKSVGEMVGGMLALKDPPGGFIRFLHRQSEGNPFFVAEYLRTAVAGRLLFRRSGQWRVAESGGGAAGPFEALPLPGSLRELVAQRLSGLTPGATRLAEAACVLGREIDSTLLAAAAGVSEGEVIEAVAELLERHVVEHGEGGGFRFVHDKLREVAYQSLAADVRGELHRRAATAIEAHYEKGESFALRYNELAHHWQEAGVDDKALRYAELAGEQALLAGAWREAIEFLGRVAAIDDRRPARERIGVTHRARVERQRGLGYYGLGAFGRARERVEHALSLLGHPVPQAKPLLVLDLLGQALRQAFHRRFYVGTPARSPEDAAREAETVLAFHALVHVFFHTNELDRYTHATLCLLNLAEQAAPSPELAEAHALTALIAGFVPLHGLAEAYAYRAEDTARRVGSPAAQASVQMITSIYRTGAGRWEKAAQDTAEGAALAERIGYARRWEESTSLGALTAYYQGDLVRSRRLWTSLQARTRSPQPTVWGHCGQAEVALRRGHAGHAEEALEQLRAGEAVLNAERLAVADEIRLFGELALARLRRGEPEAALRAAETTARLIVANPRPSAFWTIEGASCATETALTLLEEEPARKSLALLVRQLCRGLRGYSAVFPVGEPRAWLYAGRLAAFEGRSARAGKAWRRALAAAQRLRMPYDEGRAHLEIGRRLPAGDAVREERLNRARDLFARGGAERELALVESLLSHAHPAARP